MLLRQKQKRKTKIISRLLDMPDLTQVSKWVDWIELSAWSQIDEKVSKSEIAAIFNSQFDNDTADEAVEKIWEEIKTRIFCLGLSYPFVLSDTEEVFNYRGAEQSNDAYLFCLLVSYVGLPGGEKKLNVWKEGEAARIFEKICAFVSKEYVSDAHSTNTTLVEFGSPRKEWKKYKHIKEALPELVRILGDGEVTIETVRNLSRKRGDGGDGGLDILAFRKFTDGRHGNFIFLGQCAAAQDRSNYMAKVNEMQDFLTDNVRFQFPLVSGFFLPHVLSHGDEDHRFDWKKIKTREIIPFDRLRIAYYSKAWVYKDIDKLLAKCKKKIKQDFSLT